MIGFTTAQEIRDNNVKFSSSDNISDATIENRITEAENIIITDLSKVATKAQIVSIADAEPIGQLAIYKTMELCLVYLFGASRQAEEVSDIQYWIKKYDDLIQAIIDGKVDLDVGSSDISPTSIPKITSGVTEIYDDREGILDGFEPE